MSRTKEVNGRASLERKHAALEDDGATWMSNRRHLDKVDSWLQHQ